MRTYLAPVILILAALLGLAAAPVLAAAPIKEVPPPAKPGGEFPLHIISQKLEADQNAGIILFSGAVKATYGENILYSDQLRVYFQKKPEATAIRSAKSLLATISWGGQSAESCRGPAFHSG